MPQIVSKSRFCRGAIETPPGGRHSQQSTVTTPSTTTTRHYSSWPAALRLCWLLVLLLMAHTAECRDDRGGGGLPSISQISPKSDSVEQHEAHPLSTSDLTLENNMAEATILAQLAAAVSASSTAEVPETHTRAQRSAQPILNDNYPKSGPNDVHFPSVSEKESAGRYFQYNINPTGTYDDELETPELTHRARTGKTLQAGAPESDVSVTKSSSFLLKGGLRQATSGSPNSPAIQATSSTSATSTLAASATTLPHNPRQNPNPDIQDIITGIVKLLNGNVNVHANTQGVRRPSASRINNRGPPRISETQPMPLDYEAHKPAPLGTSIRPPPYPFDRPERPFITGVPIPEQIVPYRPGFVSNRPPWHRNKPRPPITTTVGGRRPLPQYKPLPSLPMSPPQDLDQRPPPPLQSMTGGVEEMDYNEHVAHTPTPTEAGGEDAEFSAEDTESDAQYIEVSDKDLDAPTVGTATLNSEEEISEQQPAPPITNIKESGYQHEKSDKKKPYKHKTSDKKKHVQDAYTTIVETSSEVHTVAQMSSTYVAMPMADPSIDPSTEEVIFMTPSKTPALESALNNVVDPAASAMESSILSSSSRISTTPIGVAAATELNHGEVYLSIEPTQSTTIATPLLPSATAITTTTTTTTSTTNKPPTTTTIPTEPDATNAYDAAPTASAGSGTPQQQPYHPRPGIVLDDPEFKPGGRPRPQRPSQPQLSPPTHIQPTRQHLPPGYGEIFDVTLSAIQGPGSGSGSQHTINIKPYGTYGSGSGGGVATGGGQPGDIIVSAAGEDGFVSIDGKRTYINLFGEPTASESPVTAVTAGATAVPQLPGAAVGGASEKSTTATDAGIYGVPETEVVELKPTKAQNAKPAPPTRPHYRQRPTQPPVRIDTCIVGDDSTCDQTQHERCKTENGVSSCHCRPGYSRRKHREPCRKVISFFLGLRVDRIYEHRIVWDNKLLDRHSEPYGQLSYESMRAIDSAMSMTPYSDEFMQAKVNNIYRGDPNLGGSGVYVNLTVRLDESVETLRPNLRSDVQKHLLGVLHRRNNNIGNSVLYVSSPEGAVSPLHDLDECQSRDLNDCHATATCSNSWGSFRCTCADGLRDPWADQPQRAGRDCQSCPDTFCNNHGTCSYNDEGAQLCACDSSHYGGQCEIDGEVLGVAIGASVAAVIIIVLTLVCLIMWSRRWQREQKNAMGSPVFGYMNTAPLKSAGLAQAGYQVTLEDRMRWAQIADVMAQTSNHYGAEPIAPTRPSSAMFAYPNLQSMMNGMGTMGGMFMQGTMQMHHNNSNNGGMAPPVPLPRYERLGLTARATHRTLENSSSSEEEDRTDLLGRNFQVPRPKSRSNGSITNQSGIYYDVDYEPSGTGVGNSSADHLYGAQVQQSSTHSHVHSHSHAHSHGGGGNHIPGPQGIPMSTYTSGRAPSSYYMK